MLKVFRFILNQENKKDCHRKEIDREGVIDVSDGGSDGIKYFMAKDFQLAKVTPK